MDHAMTDIARSLLRCGVCKFDRIVTGNHAKHKEYKRTCAMCYVVAAAARGKVKIAK